MNRMIHVRLMLALAIAGAVGVLAVANADSSRAVAIAQSGRAQVSAEEIPMLGTITVHADAAIPTLPLVIVTPDDHEVPVATTSVAVASVSGGSPALNLPDVLPHARLDMPYYSFGKSLPRTIKD